MGFCGGGLEPFPLFQWALRTPAHAARQLLRSSFYARAPRCQTKNGLTRCHFLFGINRSYGHNAMYTNVIRRQFFYGCTPSAASVECDNLLHHPHKADGVAASPAFFG